VAKHERVVLADAAADSPSPFGTTAIALVALCTGFASAYALRDHDGDAHSAKIARSVQTDVLPATAAPPAPAPAPEPEAAPDLEDRPPVTGEPAIRAAEQAAAPPAAEPPLAAEPPRPEPARATPPAEPRGQAAVAVDARRDVPGAEPPSRATSTTDPFADQRLKPGIVAYLRCDGVPQRKGPFPCPRDRDLEQRVWHTLRSLERCEPLIDARGASEVRLELTPIRTELHVVGGELDRSAVRQCAAGLTSARTSLRPERMIVAFRFALH
jgi:hypothetical protein